MVREDRQKGQTSYSKVDLVTGTDINISYEHHEIHAGSHFYVCGFETEAEDANIDFTILTGSEKEVHIVFEVEGTSQTEFRIYENAVATGGEATEPMNNNRNSATATTVILTKDPTVSDVGDLIFSNSKGLVGANPAKASNQGVVKREREIILKKSTKYLFRTTSKDDDNIISYCGEWYEHTDIS